MEQAYTCNTRSSEFYEILVKNMCDAHNTGVKEATNIHTRDLYYLLVTCGYYYALAKITL